MPSPKIASFLQATLAFLLTASAPAQLPVPAGTDLFGDAFVRKLPHAPQQGVAAPTDETKSSAPPPGYGQVLIFQNGRQLRGEIVSLDKDEIAWKRPDANGPLHFKRTEVRRIALVWNPSSADPAAPLSSAKLAAAVGETTLISGAQTPNLPATVKLAGADWLFGKLTSADGQMYALEVSPELTFQLSRSQIRWLYFDHDPAPAFGFFAQRMDPDDWYGDTGDSELTVDDGNLTLHYPAQWIGHAMPARERLQLSFEMPAKRQNTDILFRADSSPPFDSQDLARVILPAPNQRDSPVRFRIYYDGAGPEKHLYLFQNDERVTQPGSVILPKWVEDHKVRSIAVRSMSSSNGFAMALTHLEVQPWNGLLPEEGVTAEKADLVSTTQKLATGGKLESVSAETVCFSGSSMPIEAGLFVQFEGQTVAAPLPILAFFSRQEEN